MKKRCRKDFSVFDFDEAEFQFPDKLSEKFRRSTSPAMENKPAISKYDFLRCFMGGDCTSNSETIEQNVHRPEDVEEKYIKTSTSPEQSCKDAHPPLGFSPAEGMTASSAAMEEPIELENACNVAHHRQSVFAGNLTESLLVELKNCGVQESSIWRRNSNSIRAEQQSDEMFYLTSDDDGRCLGSRVSDSDADSIEKEDDRRELSPKLVRDGCFELKNKLLFPIEESRSQEINFIADFVLYSDKVCSYPALTFTSDHIKFERSYASKISEAFAMELPILDIHSITCHQIEHVPTFLLILQTASCMLPEGICASGLLKLVCAVSDFKWPELEKNIISLSERYHEIWKTGLEHLDCIAEAGATLDEFLRLRAVWNPTWYEENFGGNFNDLVFPKGDVDAVSVSKRDIELLQPDIFINDTIIDFYIKYLECGLAAEDKRRFHFFNSFFFRKLADLDKHPGHSFEGKVAFQRVRKWTRKVNIFEQDYIFIPVNFSYHWSLIVICHPGEATKCKERDDGLDRVPCVLHFDSLKGTHRGLKALIQSYLLEEWKERHMGEKESSEDAALKFKNMRFVPLEVPQQENIFDCGLFLLHYVELFLKESPRSFNPFQIKRFSKFLNRGWFPPVEASRKRYTIQRLIYELHCEQSASLASKETITSHKHSVIQEGCCDNDLDVEMVMDRCIPGPSNEHPIGSNADKGVYGNSPGPSNEHPIGSNADIGVCEDLTMSSLHSLEVDKNMTSGYKELSKMGSTDLSSSEDTFKAFQQAMPIQLVTQPVVHMEDIARKDMGQLCRKSNEAQTQSHVVLRSSVSNELFEDAAVSELSEVGRCPESIQLEVCADRSASCESSSCDFQLKVDSSDYDPLPPQHESTHASWDNEERCVERIDRDDCNNPDDDRATEVTGSADSFFSCQDNGGGEPTEYVEPPGCSMSKAASEIREPVTLACFDQFRSFSRLESHEMVFVDEDEEMRDTKRLKLVTDTAAVQEEAQNKLI